jgi:MFS transporter, PPP family, 3-phenylpropionic acid transporter
MRCPRAAPFAGASAYTARMSSVPAAPIPAFRLSSFYFAYYAALGAFNPYWGLFLKARGMDVAAISVLMSLWYATRMVAPTAWSLLAARAQRPVHWLRLGCALTLASFAAFVLPLGFAALFATMVVFCFAYNAVMPQFEALTLSHLDGRAERYGRIRVWGSIGFIAVVGLLGVVFDHVAVDWLPWLMLPLFAGLLAAAFVNDYGRAHVERAAGADEEGFWRRLHRPQVIAFFVVALLVQLSFGPYNTFYSIYLDAHGYRASALGLFWMIGVLLEIAVFFLSARIFARWSAASLLMASLIASALRWTATALWPESAVLMACAQALHALSFAGFFAAAMHFLAAFFPGAMNGHGQGVFYGFSSGVGGVLGALAAGQVWRLSGGETAFALAGVVALLAVAIAAVWLRPGRVGV